MQELSEIVRMVTSGRLRVRKPYLDENHESLLGRFYEGIKEGRFATDQDAAHDLYGTGPDDPRYKTLKARLKERLMLTMRLLDTPRPGVTNYREAQFRAMRDLELIRTMLVLGGRAPGIPMLRHVLAIAQKYTVTDVELACYKILREDAMMKGKKKQYEQLNQQLSEALERYRLELRAEEMDDRLLIWFVISGSQKPELRDMAAEFIQEIAEIRSRCRTRQTHYFYFHITSLAHQIRLEYDKAVEVCNEADLFYREHPEFAVPNTLATIAAQRTSCAFYNRDYSAAKVYAEQEFELLTEGTNNWLASHQTYFLIAMHLADYDLALTIYLRATRHPRFSVGIPPGFIEKWKIFEGYLHYIVKRGLLPPPDSRSKGLEKNFRLEKFLNDFKLVSHDKQGTNFAILILQVMWLLETERFLDLMGLANSLKAYAGRHLQGAYFQRANRFVKLILVMIDSDFNVDEMHRKGAKHKSALIAQTGTPASIAVDGIEVIPYETLWDHMLEKSARVPRV